MSTPQWFAELEREEAKRMDRIDRIKGDMEREKAMSAWPDVTSLLREIDRLCAEQRYKIAALRREADIEERDYGDSEADLEAAFELRYEARIREELADLFGNLWRGPKPKEPEPVPSDTDEKLPF
jgi:hypothetical protein